ncbi:hypothetical protein [Herbaspirillum rubrisubalbicans]|uniref:hypothetical protein n=1 Tax=Herbaspirillum rubrisubalbicans TaxID=80842 RepID=UPI0011BF4A9A|nr:hypothetical protein [Herbaspirillum rubrisubalbicans]
MSVTIVDEARSALQSLEHQTMLLNALSSLAGSTSPHDVADLSLLLHHHTVNLHEQFQAFHSLVTRQILPLVADVKNMKLSAI